MTSSDSKDHLGAAFMRVHRAIDSGRLSRPERCEICGKTEVEVNADIEARRGHAARKSHVIHAHHYMGHEYALDVWWICTSCNGMLWGYHDGSLTIEDARAMWRARQGAASIPLAGGRVLHLRVDPT